jgi:hypothetical protein
LKPRHDDALSVLRRFAPRRFAIGGRVLAAGRGEEINLRPGGAPGSEGVTAAEVSKPPPTRIMQGCPQLHGDALCLDLQFPPAKRKATGAAIVVAPAGRQTQLEELLATHARNSRDDLRIHMGLSHSPAGAPPDVKHNRVRVTFSAPGRGGNPYLLSPGKM